MQFFDDFGSPALCIEVASAAEQPVGRDVEVRNEVGEPAELEGTSHGIVFFHRLEVPAVYAVPVSKGLDTAKNLVGDKAINGSEEAGDNRNGNFIVVEDVHSNRFRGVNNSFPGGRMHAGKFHQYHCSISQYVYSSSYLYHL